MSDKTKIHVTMLSWLNASFHFGTILVLFSYCI
uniref:Uncharacterized protein n=1 Tax=Rhizophora mucronata TaxID=61149 RepID=A0A2P2N2C9_RHIMU